MTPAPLFDQVVRITYVYLGPASDRFVSRQISNHLHKKPQELELDDLPELIDWVRLAMGFLTEDKKMIDMYVGRLEALEREQQTKPATKKRQAKAAVERNIAKYVENQ